MNYMELLNKEIDEFDEKLISKYGVDHYYDITNYASEVIFDVSNGFTEWSWAQQ